MPSPFPGMDPYLESHWRDVPHRLITYASDALQEVLPPELRARVEERVVLETPENLGQSLFPDMRVVESRQKRHGSVTAVKRLAGTQAIVVDAEREPATEGYIEIIAVGSGNRVVTIIEFLGPANKTPGDGMEEHQRKQPKMSRSDTNLVEINPNRTGTHVLAVPLGNISPTHHTPYMVYVRRATVPSKAEVYPIFLSQKLPTVLIPLRRTDADVPLDLQELIDECYRKGRYEGDLDYSRDPYPPLTGPDAAWAIELLHGKGLGAAGPTRKNRKRKPPRAKDQNPGSK